MLFINKISTASFVDPQAWHRVISLSSFSFSLIFRFSHSFFFFWSYFYCRRKFSLMFTAFILNIPSLRAFWICKLKAVFSFQHNEPLILRGDFLLEVRVDRFSPSSRRSLMISSGCETRVWPWKKTIMVLFRI